jgi:membrane associated rhomboid family serine protease
MIRATNQMPPKESVPQFLDRTNLEEFRRKTLLFGGLTLGGLVLWLVAAPSVSPKAMLPILGGLAWEAIKNAKHWHEWLEQHPGHERVHPDRVREIEQETVRVMADAVKAKAWFTRGIVVAIAIPSFLQLFAGLQHSVDVASVHPVAIRGGEWWRLLGGTYLHGSFYHFMGNTSALLVYGAILESKGSHLRLPLVYLLSCLGGSLASVLLPPDVPSIGASGGVVGVIAYLFLFSRRQSVQFPPAFRGATASVFVGLIVAGALGFWYIDNPGHAGGAAMGFILAALIVDQARNFDREVQLPILDMFGWLAAALLATGSIVTSAALILK